MRLALAHRALDEAMVRAEADGDRVLVLAISRVAACLESARRVAVDPSAADALDD